MARNDWNDYRYKRERERGHQDDRGDEKKIYVTVAIDAVLYNSLKAARVGIDNRELSIPHSVIHGGAPDADDESITTLEVEEWFAVREGLA
jgi:hypothetical protein